MRLVYKCHYDGEICDKEIPKLDNEGNVIKPAPHGIKSINNDDWKICMSCNRNCCMSGTCFGKLEVIY